MRQVLGFSAACAGIIGTMLVVAVLGFPGDDVRRAVQVSAAVALLVQVAGFLIARAMARENVMAGWAVAIVLRFGAIAAMALVAPRQGLLPGATLLSLASFLFVSTLVEPLFLKK